MEGDTERLPSPKGGFQCTVGAPWQWRSKKPTMWQDLCMSKMLPVPLCCGLGLVQIQQPGLYRISYIYIMLYVCRKWMSRLCNNVETTASHHIMPANCTDSTKPSQLH